MIFLVSIPFFLKTLVMLSHEELRLKVFFEGCPVATNDTIIGNDRLKNAAVVVGLVAVIRGKDDIAAFVTDKIFVIGRNQEVFPLAETTGAAIIGQIEFPMW